jgi:translation initiation factor 2B subunit (eIF-2B alpha/beta/delta family)
MSKKILPLIEDKKVLLTHSRSSTVINVLKEIKKNGKKFKIYITESRPGEEGKKTFKELKKAGLEVELIPDLYVTKIIENINGILFGADCVFEDKIINKVGTYVLCLLGKHFKIPTFCLTSSLKISNNLKNLPRTNDLFEEIPITMIDHFITDE